MKTLPTFLVSLSLLLPAAHASRLVDNLKAGKDQTVVVYGTSLTAGGKWVPEMATWLQSINPAAKVTVVNRGQSGKNSLVGMALVERAVIKQKPDAVLIEFAVNDAVLFPDEKDRVPLADCGKNLETIVGEIRKALPEAEIFIQTMNPAWDSPAGKPGPMGSGAATKRPQLAAYYEEYRKTAAKLGLPLIDHEKNWNKIREENEEKFKEYVKDGVHPTAEASVAVTFPEVKKVLEK